MKKIVVCCFALLCFTAVEAQKLNFNKNGIFKIAQFTDVHYVPGNSKSDTALLAIQRVLDMEKPDMVIFTGDIVTGKPVKTGWDNVTKLVIDRKIPFAVALGNH
ncbi:MAG TPA: metallophosphoesterase, partial [Petrimonas sp.]|nr:metallophosphoesterase [Petrimonas sp.]